MIKSSLYVNYIQPAVSRVYNSPAALYSEENLAAALQESGLQAAEADVTNTDKVDSSNLIPVAVTSNPVANGGSGTHKVYIETKRDWNKTLNF